MQGQGNKEGEDEEDEDGQEDEELDAVVVGSSAKTETSCRWCPNEEGGGSSDKSDPVVDVPVVAPDFAPNSRLGKENMISFGRKQNCMGV